MSQANVMTTGRGGEGKRAARMGRYEISREESARKNKEGAEEKLAVESRWQRRDQSGRKKGTNGRKYSSVSKC